MLDLIRLFDAVEMAPHLLHATSRGSDDAIEILEVLDKKVFCRLRVAFVSAVGHWLTTTGLIEGVTYVEPESLEELERGDSNFWIDHVDITGYEETDFHILGKLALTCRSGLRRHLHFLSRLGITEDPYLSICVMIRLEIVPVRYVV